MATRGNNDLALISALQDIYNDMIDILQNSSFTLGFQSMLCTGISFFYTIFTSFLCYKGFLFDQDEFKDDALASLFWLGFVSVCPTLLIIMGELMSQQAKKIQTHFNKIVRRSKNQNEINALLMFCDCIQRHPPVFTTGLFDFNLKLAFGVRKLSYLRSDTMKQFNYRP